MTRQNPKYMLLYIDVTLSLRGLRSYVSPLNLSLFLSLARQHNYTAETNPDSLECCYGAVPEPVIAFR